MYLNRKLFFLLTLLLGTICLAIGLALGVAGMRSAPVVEPVGSESSLPQNTNPASAPSATIQPAGHSQNEATEADPAAVIADIQVTLPKPTPEEPASAAVAPGSPHQTPPRAAQDWRSWPIIPSLTDTARQIYLRGLAAGLASNHYSTVGDCQSVPLVFMGSYDQSPEYWPGWDYASMMPTIQHFQGSFGRRSAATANGLSVASALSPFWADQDQCNPGESPIECEFRVHQPAIVFINLGTNHGKVEAHAAYLRQILDFAVSRGVVPILSTKGDNSEGDHSINLSVAQLALEYDLPLWNFWAAIQHLPDQGLDPDRPGGNYLTREAWAVRSVTGLQVLDTMLREMQSIHNLVNSPDVPEH